ncbi:VanZ family protein [Nocardioides sp. GXZ039]|uniref:VanZ family protein n=1 Tax=Nocardioides sp. GXZ039 TaxID=3136018 RepID=UPI0030F4506E
MEDQVVNAIVAIVLGSVAAVVLLVPTAAYQYRLDGKLQPKDLLVLVASAIYSLSLWTYTLLPMPEPGSYRCQGRQLIPFHTISGIWTDAGAADHTLQIGQVGLNVLLFVPLGYFLRVIVKRGVVTSLVVGLGVSLLIEFTQNTGVRGLYDCPYRLFDVDDLILNTLGAVVGSMLSYVFLDRRDDSTPPLPTSVTLGRRVTGLVCDVIFSGLVGGAASAVYRGFTLYGPGTYDLDVRLAILVGVPFLIQAACVLGAGRTVGEYVVAVRTVRPGAGAMPLRRLVKLLVGPTPLFVLVWLAIHYNSLWPVLAFVVLAVVNVVVAWRTEQHRGLSNLVAGLDLRIATDEALHRADPEAQQTPT